MTEPAAIDLPAFYANPDRNVAVLNYNARFITSIFDLVNSDELAAFINLFLAEQRAYVPDDADPATTFNRVDAPTYVATLKAILTNQPDAFDQ